MDDVAAIAGVSRMTVSRALNGRRNVSWAAVILPTELVVRESA